MSRLSRHFTEAEFCKSATALRRGIANVMGPAERAKAALLCEKVLEPVRVRFGRPVVLNSGYRCRKLNLAVGSKPGSQHEQGEAADIEVPGVPNGEVAAYIRDHLKFDQLILEFYTPGQPSSGWVHVSYDPDRLRQQVLTIGPAGTFEGLRL